MRKLLRIAFVTVCLASAWAKVNIESAQFREPTRDPSSIAVVGPGIVVSIHLLNLPFVKSRFAVKFQTDAGELIEIWHPGTNLPVIVGARGMLIYSTHPEMILGFRMSPKDTRRP